MLVVGSLTDSLRKGGCQYCGNYDAWTQRCLTNHWVDYRSFIHYECEKADRDGLRIVVIYNYASVRKEKCPEILRYSDIHINGYYIGADGKHYWEYAKIRDAIMG